MPVLRRDGFVPRHDGRCFENTLKSQKSSKPKLSCLVAQLKDHIMKNPFAKNDNTVWVAAAAIGAIAAAAIAWFYLRRDKDESPEEQPQQEYLEHPQKKKKKTDLHDLQPIVPNPEITS